MRDRKREEKTEKKRGRERGRGGESCLKRTCLFVHRTLILPQNHIRLKNDFCVRGDTTYVRR